MERVRPQVPGNVHSPETAPKNSTKIYWKMVAMSGAFLFVYALTMM